MAILNVYKCTSCGLTGLVSGGRDALMSGPTQTYYSPEADELIDELLPGFPHLDLDCKEPVESHKLIPWSKGEPCPKCGGLIELDIDGEGNYIEIMAD
ncbi:hypothetical protein MX350_004524 [Vibrio parahaemolyticus]|nr:hypothetical protein [Vibrio parahaemolyticus]EJG1998048.1 hypothetical protein [Vibrio parahaemolyticus]